MYEINNTVRDSIFDGLTATVISKTETCETLLITLEEDAVFPEHTSPRDALLVMLEGAIVFNISGREFRLEKYQTFTFPADEKHQVLAKENAKFLIVR
ncbi:MAG: cupin domain-containing protein [Flavobacteriaceae bacterium]|nr:cupin domain-containing protein [Flavobacteriaceae bacterium]